MSEKHSFQAALTAHIEINDSDFEFLTKECLSHYDFTVQSSAEVGGFLYGFKNRREFSSGRDKVVEMTMRQLSLMIKCLEMTRTTQGYTMSSRFLNIAKELNEKEAEINEKL